MYSNITSPSVPHSVTILSIAWTRRTRENYTLGIVFKIHEETVARLVKALRYKPESYGFESRWCHWNFYWHNPIGHTMSLGVDPNSNRNEYQEYFLGVKAAGAWGWRPNKIHVPTVLKSENLTFLEPCSGLNRTEQGLLYIEIYIHEGTSTNFSTQAMMQWILGRVRAADFMKRRQFTESNHCWDSQQIVHFYETSISVHNSAK
jgi:hypothetical protein